MKKLLPSTLQGMVWDSKDRDQSKAWTKEIGERIKARMLEIEPSGFKYVVTTQINENLGQGGRIAPDFSAETTQGPIKFHEWLGNSWGVLFSHPADFTPVCTTELGEVARRQKDFEARGVKVIGISANGLESHTEWIKDINEVGSKIAPTNVQFPIIADADRQISTLYDMLDAVDPTNVDAKGIPFTIRTVFVIDPKKVIRLTISYPAQTGRSFDEILRVIDSLQLGDKHRITTPVNWKKGDDVIIHPGVSDAEAKTLFPNYTTHKPYLRTTTQPN
ncbi:hypothetical protein FRC11_003918 [Ceratobasidium sp. 423]|nr:hypothetical protein FRC11_003918 [Ceratobasidium sp. 423]